MLKLTMRWTWLAWVVFFFAWFFVIHGVGIVLHEVAGHGLVATIVACGFDGVNLTYFGRGFARLTQCPPELAWTWKTHVIIDWAGPVVPLGAGAVAMVLQRRAGLAPLARLLLALLATQFLLGELGYATTGGFYQVYDPAWSSVILENRGQHFLAWLPPLVLYTATALYGARAIVGAFREHFRTHTRLQTLKRSTTTLGAAWLFSFAAYRIEAAIRTDMVPSITVAAERRAVALKQMPWLPVHRFPIHLVLVVVAVASFIVALAWPVVGGDGGQDAAPTTIPRRYAVGVAGAALLCAVTITLLMRI